MFSALWFVLNNNLVHHPGFKRMKATLSVSPLGVRGDGNANYRSINSAKDLPGTEY
jgi:hypothetical protein